MIKIKMLDGRARLYIFLRKSTELSTSLFVHLEIFRERDSGLTNTSVRVVIELIQRGSIHCDAPPTFSCIVQVGAKVIKSVEILRDALNELFELWVRLWARSEQDHHW